MCRVFDPAMEEERDSLCENGIAKRKNESRYCAAVVVPDVGVHIYTPIITFVVTVNSFLSQNN